MRWTLAILALLLCGMASAAPIAVTCYDGAPSATVRWTSVRRTARVAVCDVDERRDGRCRFQLSLPGTPTQPAREFDLSIPTGHRTPIHHAGRAVVLACQAGPEPRPRSETRRPPVGADVVACHDAEPATGGGDPVCDLDGSCDDVCTFGFHTPLCCSCRGDRSEAIVDGLSVPVGGHHVVPRCRRTGRATLVLECHPRTPEAVCPPSTTRHISSIAVRVSSRTSGWRKRTRSVAATAIATSSATS